MKLRMWPAVYRYLYPEEIQLWHKARKLFEFQRASILHRYPANTPPLRWHDLGMEVRLMWWEKAARVEDMMLLPARARQDTIPDDPPTRPDMPKSIGRYVKLGI
jgi:hypothetical protein